MSNAAATTKLTPKYSLSIGGEPADMAVLEAVIVIRVRQHTTLADVLELKLSNEGLVWTEADTFVEGTKLSVSLGFEETGIEHVIDAEVGRREVEFPVRGPSILTLVCFSKKLQLSKGAQSRSFTDIKVSDIATQIAGDLGLSADVDDTGETLPYVLQAAEDDLGFLRRRGNALGFDVMVDKTNSKLIFKRPDTSPAAAATLKWGETLLSFRPRMTSDAQVSKLTVKGWDPMQKTVVSHTATPSDVVFGMGGTKTGSQLAEGSFGSREVLVVDPPVSSTASAEALAKAMLNVASATYCEGDGSCVGDPAVRPGAILELQGCGNRCDGKYFVVDTLHYFEPRIGYTTQFGVKRSSEGAPQPPPALAEAPPGEERQPIERSRFGSSVAVVATVVPPPPAPATAPAPAAAPTTKTIRFKIEDEDGEPLASKPFSLQVAGETIEGTTDASGYVIADVPNDARDGELTFWLEDDKSGDSFTWPLKISGDGR